MHHPLKRPVLQTQKGPSNEQPAGRKIAPPPFQLSASDASPVSQADQPQQATKAELQTEREQLDREWQKLYETNQFDRILYHWLNESQENPEILEQTHEKLARNQARALEIKARHQAIGDQLAELSGKALPEAGAPSPKAPQAPQAPQAPAFDLQHHSDQDLESQAKDFSPKLSAERQKLAKEFAKLQEGYQYDNVLQQWLTESGQSPEILEATKAKIARNQARGREILARQEAIAKDLEALQSKNPATVKAALERAKGTFLSTETTVIANEGVSVDGLKASRKSNVRKEKTTAGDQSLEISAEDAASLDLETMVFTQSATKKNAFNDGEKDFDQSKVRSSAIDLQKGSHTSSESSEETVKKDGATEFKDASGRDVKRGLEGYSDRKWQEKIEDGKINKRESTFNVSRGDGQMGVGKSWKSAKGETGKDETKPKGEDELKKYDPNAKDKSGTMVKGTEFNGGGEGGAVFGPEGVGAFGKGEAGMTKHHGDGLKTGFKVGAGGKMVVSVKEVPNTSPKQYAIQVLIDTQASFGASGGKEFKNGTELSATFARASSTSTVYSKVLSAEAAQEYLAALGEAERGKPNPKHPEMAVIATGTNEGWDTAKKALEQRGDISAEGIKGMSEGDSFTETEKGSNDLGFGGAFKGYGANIGIGEDHERIRGVRYIGGKAILTVQVKDTERTSGGMKAGGGFANMGVNYGQSEAYTHNVTVSLDPKMANFAATVAQIQAIDSYMDMVRFQQSHPHIKVQFGSGREVGDKLDTTVDIGPVSIGMSDSASHSYMDNADGSSDYKGNNTLGGGIGALGLNLGTSSSESLSAHVDAEGKARMDLSETNKEFDLSKSASSAADSLMNAPGTYLAELLTGSAKPIKETSNIPGTLMTDQEVQLLINLASNANKWGDATMSPRLREDWMSLRTAIRNAKGDRKRIAQALTEFVGKRGHGRRETLEAALRLAGGKDNEGYRYEFPEGTEHLKPSFEKWVYGKPHQEVMALIQAGKQPEALLKAKELLREIQMLKGGLATAKVKDKSRFSDMVQHLDKPEAEVQGLVNRLENPDASPEEVAEKDLKKQYDRLLMNCKRYRHNFRQSLARVAEMRSDGHLGNSETIETITLVNQSKELVAAWEKDFALLKTIATEQGFGGSAKEWAHYSPDSGWLQLMAKGETALQYSPEAEAKRDAAQAKAVEEARYKDEIAEENQKIVRRTMDNMPWNLEYRAQQQAKKEIGIRQQEKQALHAQWMPILKAAKNAAAMAAGKCNGMNARGQAAMIKPAASKLWSAAFASLSKGNSSLQHFQAILGNSNYHTLAMKNAAATTQALYQKALAQFKEGNQAQG